MNAELQDSWTADVDRANSRALDDWERVLDSLDRLLSESWDRSASGLRRNDPRWSAAVEAAVQASARLQRGLRLSRARYRDAELAGLADHPEMTLMVRARRASERSEELGREIRSRLSSISQDLQSRRPRRSRHAVFSPGTPSLVDIHV